jgi:hypothetical protein
VAAKKDIAITGSFCGSAVAYVHPKSSYLASIVVLALTAACQASLATAAVVLPSGLEPGSLYQIAFVTKGARDAFSGDIAVYNGFVRLSATQSTDLPSTTWWAVASTGGPAQNNAKVYAGVPIYNTAGERVAANGDDFYSSTHESPIVFDQFGDYRLAQVWTGMYANGSPDQYLDNFLPTTTYGVSDRLDSAWARGGLSSNRMESRALYALSEPLVAVPEPITHVIAFAGLACGGFSLWQRHKQT